MRNIILKEASDLMEAATALRAQQLWGDAINTYMDCIHKVDGFVSEDASEMEEAFQLREKATTAIEFIYDITGFVNVDLMNP